MPRYLGIRIVRANIVGGLNDVGLDDVAMPFGLCGRPVYGRRGTTTIIVSIIGVRNQDEAGSTVVVSNSAPAWFPVRNAGYCEPEHLKHCVPSRQ
jgi:hypothetical protein